MIRKLPSGQYRLYSRKKNPKTGKRRNLGTFRNAPKPCSMNVRSNTSSGIDAGSLSPSTVGLPGFAQSTSDLGRPA